MKKNFVLDAVIAIVFTIGLLIGHIIEGFALGSFIEIVSIVGVLVCDLLAIQYVAMHFKSATNGYNESNEFFTINILMVVAFVLLHIALITTGVHSIIAILLCLGSMFFSVHLAHFRINELNYHISNNVNDYQ